MNILLDRRRFTLGFIGAAVTLAAPVAVNAAQATAPARIGCGRMHQVDLRKFYMKSATGRV